MNNAVACRLRNEAQCKAVGRNDSIKFEGSLLDKTYDEAHEQLWKIN